MLSSLNINMAFDPVYLNAYIKAWDIVEFVGQLLNLEGRGNIGVLRVVVVEVHQPFGRG